MDIGSRNTGVAGRLSNFTIRPFVFDGVECTSMEGLLQSFKFENPAVQIEVCKLGGMAAKRRGRSRNKAWQRKQTLWWQGQMYMRKSKGYQCLLMRAYDALCTNEKFLNDLLATGNANLTHSIGSRKEADTVLTEREFCRILTHLREKYKEA